MGLHFFNINFNVGFMGNFLGFPAFPSFSVFPVFDPYMASFPRINFESIFSYDKQGNDVKEKQNNGLGLSGYPSFNYSLDIPAVFYTNPFENIYSCFDIYERKTEKQKETKQNTVKDKKTDNTRTGSAKAYSLLEAVKKGTKAPSLPRRVDNSYASLSQSEAEKKAKNDPNLEKLTGNPGYWSVANTFETDIPYAKKGTGKILTEVAKLIGEELVITSALGTNGTEELTSPHTKSLGKYNTHHNAENPKLDIRVSAAHMDDLAKKLQETGYFSHILPETTGGTHLDVQIDPSKFESLDLLV